MSDDYSTNVPGMAAWLWYCMEKVDRMTAREVRAAVSYVPKTPSYGNWYFPGRDQQLIRARAFRDREHLDMVPMDFVDCYRRALNLRYPDNK